MMIRDNFMRRQQKPEVTDICFPKECVYRSFVTKKLAVQGYFTKQNS